MTAHITREMSIAVPFRNKNTHAWITVYNGTRNMQQLLCLHGIGSTGRESFDALAQELSTDVSLVTIDWIGYGKSSRPLGVNDSYDAQYCSAWMGACINYMVEHSILSQLFHILVTSMSAIALGYLYTQLRPLLNRIIVVNPAGFDTRINPRFACVLTAPFFNQHKLARAIANTFFWKHILGWNEKHRQRLIEGINSGELEVLLRYAQAGIRPTGTMKCSHVIPEYFAEIDHPVMLVHSSCDHVFPKQEYLTYARQFGWQVRSIDFHDHNIVTKRAQEITRYIKFFLDTRVSYA